MARTLGGSSPLAFLHDHETVSHVRRVATTGYRASSGIPYEGTSTPWRSSDRGAAGEESRERSRTLDTREVFGKVERKGGTPNRSVVRGANRGRSSIGDVSALVVDTAARARQQKEEDQYEDEQHDLDRVLARPVPSDPGTIVSEMGR